jgi:hypothetical protein
MYGNSSSGVPTLPPIPTWGTPRVRPVLPTVW